MRTLIIDNYDSFTNNLYQYVASINIELPIIIRNDSMQLTELTLLEFDNIIISPGPGRPDNPSDFGICKEVLLKCNVPILGICLGHQGIGFAYGGEVIHAPIPMHGRKSYITHYNDELFNEIPQTFSVVRYHSLIINKNNLPDCLNVIAATNCGLIMGIKHDSKPIYGVQFHPESIETEYGLQLIKNFIDISKNKTLSSIKCRSATYAADKIAFLANDQNSMKNLEPNSQNSSSSVLIGRSITDNRKNQYKLLVKKINKFYQVDLVFQHLFACKNNVIWLDSSMQNHSLSRFSIMGCLDGPHGYHISYDVNTKIVSYRQGDYITDLSMSIFDFLKEKLADNTVVLSEQLPFNFKCGFVGYLGYELYKDTLGINPKHKSMQPDAQFLFIDRAIVFDNVEKSCYLLALHIDEDLDQVEEWINKTSVLLDESISIEKTKFNLNANACEIKLSREKIDYIKDIERCLDYIRDGESYEVCLTNRASIEKYIPALPYYLALRSLNPAPFSAFLKFDNLSICSASIERFLAIDKDGLVESKPIKGTLPRGGSVREDEILRYSLQNDEKFRSENLMIVDLLRNDLGGVCAIGSIKVPTLMDVESFASVHQLVSTIHGKLDKKASSIDCIKAAFPGGSMTGAPKRRTIEIIDNLEQEARGVYSGAIGYISLDGAVDLNIVIRTAIITENKLSIGIGGAIIALSDPEDEYAEILLKLKALINV